MHQAWTAYIINEAGKQRSPGILHQKHCRLIDRFDIFDLVREPYSFEQVGSKLMIDIKTSR